MTRRNDERVGELASAQHGVVSRRQLLDAGLGQTAIRQRIASGALIEESERALRVRGAPATDMSRTMAAVLDAGPRAYVSHRTAAAIWGLAGYLIEPLEVTGKRGRVAHDRPHLATVHQPRRVRSWHLSAVDAVPVATPTRTLFDLAGLPDVHPRKIERTLDAAWSRNLVSHKSLTRMLEDLAVRGRPGITLMRELLDARPADHRPPESGLESRLQELARAIGLRSFVRQADVGDDDGWVGRVDFLDEKRRIVVEVGSALFHGSLTDQRRDAVRLARLAAAGWNVVCVTDVDLFQRPEHVQSRLRTVNRPVPTSYW